MNGLYTARVTDRGVHEAFIEEEILELERINRLTRQRREASEREQLRQRRDSDRDARSHWERNRTMVTAAFAALAIFGVLLGLARFGAIAGWVAHTGIAAAVAAACCRIREVSRK